MTFDVISDERSHVEFDSLRFKPAIVITCFSVFSRNWKRKEKGELENEFSHRSLKMLNHIKRYCSYIFTFMQFGRDSEFKCLNRNIL